MNQFPPKHPETYFDEVKITENFRGDFIPTAVDKEKDIGRYLSYKVSVSVPPVIESTETPTYYKLILVDKNIEYTHRTKFKTKKKADLAADQILKTVQEADFKQNSIHSPTRIHNRNNS